MRLGLKLEHKGARRVCRTKEENIRKRLAKQTSRWPCGSTGMANAPKIVLIF
jgi:hypothetical protein